MPDPFDDFDTTDGQHDPWALLIAIVLAVLITAAIYVFSALQEVK